MVRGSPITSSGRWSLEEPPVGTIGMVPADRIIYTKHWLRREGYAPRQCWRRAPPAPELS